MSITYISWDASFRENPWTLDTWAAQPDGGQFIWVDMYASPREWHSKYPRVEFLDLNAPRNEIWHLGKMVNHALLHAKHPVIVIMDGDVHMRDICSEHLLEAHACAPDSAYYLRRHDQIEQGDMEYKPCGGLNYASGLMIAKETLVRVGGWTELPIFAGPGAVAKELAMRLCNVGCPHVWSPDLRLYHPWHANTRTSQHNPLVRLQGAMIAFILTHMITHAEDPRLAQEATRLLNLPNPTTPLWKRFLRRAFK